MNTNTLKDMLARWAVLMAEKKDWLIELDSGSAYVRNNTLRAVIGMPPEEKHDE